MRNLFKQMKFILGFLVASLRGVTAISAPPFPFGNSTNDTLTPIGNGEFSPRLALPKTMAYFGYNATSIIQSVDGSVVLFYDVGVSIAGYVNTYFMDIDTSNGGANQNQVWLRVGNKTDDLNLARDIIAGNGTIFNPQAIVVATWYKVEAYKNIPAPGPQNTFQLIMPYRDTGETWVIFAFSQLEYFFADAGGFAKIYLERGSAELVRLFNTINSTIAMQQLLNGTNCNRTGIYVYQINAGVTQAPTKAPTKAPTLAPTRAKCGLFGWSIFYPFTLCGILGRWLGLCQSS